MRLNLDRVVQVSTTQLEEGLIMLTSVFTEKGLKTKVNLHTPNQIMSCEIVKGNLIIWTR